MIVIAHRGASAERPENSLAAFERAIELGADMIELDLRVSLDGQVYVAHDAVTDRRPGAIFPPGRPLAWRDIRARGAAEGRYPSLEEVLDLCAGRIELNLEVKERRATLPLLAALARRGGSEGLILSSFDPRVAREVRERAPRLRLGLLARRLPWRLAAALRGIGAKTLHAPLRSIRPGLVARTHACGARLLVWTVDAPERIQRLRAMGVDGVFTNDPARVLRLLGRARDASAPTDRADL